MAFGNYTGKMPECGNLMAGKNSVVRKGGFLDHRVGKPSDDFLLESVVRNADGAAMIGAGYLPQSDVVIVESDGARVADRDVAVLLAVYQQYRDVCLRECLTG
jgi:hypothetical protein